MALHMGGLFLILIFTIKVTHSAGRVVLSSLLLILQSFIEVPAFAVNFEFSFQNTPQFIVFFTKHMAHHMGVHMTSVELGHKKFDVCPFLLKGHPHCTPYVVVWVE